MDSENRSDGRSNVFLAASLQAGGRAVPIRIRNISRRGALLESPTILPDGTEVRLTRGGLSAVGKVAWHCERHCGINFDGEIDVARWVQRTENADQQRVDSVVAAIRTSDNVPPELQSSQRLDSISSISKALDQLCEKLAGSPHLSLELGEDLIKLDSLAQALRRLATKHPL